jgi:hypothetical protein
MDNTPPQSSAIPPPLEEGVSGKEVSSLHDPLVGKEVVGNDALVHDGGFADSSSLLSNNLPNMEGWYALATALLYLVIFRVSTFLPTTATSIVFVTLVAMVMVLVFTVRVARAIRTPAALGVNFLLTAIFVLPLIAFPIVYSQTAAWSGWQMVGPVYGRYFRLVRHVMGLKELLLMWFAACIGVGISRLVREMKMLLPIASVLALVDIYAVLGGGIVHQAITGKSPLARTAMNALTVQLPSTKAEAGSAPIPLLIGFADFLFIALFFACFRRFGVPAWRTFVALCAVLSIYMAVVAYTDIALPALVPIAVVIIGMNLRQFRYERSEAFALLYAALLLLGIGGAFWFLGHH